MGIYYRAKETFICEGCGGASEIYRSGASGAGDFTPP
jgi:hypothetical protein